MNKLLFYVFLLGFNIGQTQTIIKIYVKDSLVQPVNSSSIIIKSNNKILGYGYTDENGFFEKKVKYANEYEIKVISLGYETFFKKVKPVNKKIELNIVLKNKSVQLNPVTINSDIPELIQKKDTIIFNLKKIVSGDEMTLKDLIRKMPGLKIKNDGSITINGKDISKILVEDKEFFNKQVQLTYNTIPAKIVKGLEVYENYKDILTNKSVKPERVLNVKVKDKYKNKLIGSASILGAYSKKYDINLDLFKFQKNISLTYIGNYNNIARSTMSLKDYLDFINDNDFADDNTSNIFYTQPNIPKFLLPNQNIKSLSLGFSAINLSYKKKKKLSVNSFLLFNNSRQNKYLLSKKVYNNNDIIENNQYDADRLNIYNYFFNLKYLVNQGNSIQIISKIFYDNDTNNSLIQENINYLKAIQQKNNLGINFKLRHIHSFKNGNDIIQKLVFNYENTSNDFDIEANKDYYSFNNLLNPNHFNYVNPIKSKQFNYRFNYNCYLKNSFIKWYFGNTIKWYDNNSVSNLNSYNESLFFNYQRYNLGFNFKYDGLAIHYNTNLSLNYFNQEKNNSYIYPEIILNFSYLFRLNHSLTLGSRIFNSIIWDELYLKKKHLLNLYEIDKGSNLQNKFYPAYLFFMNYSNYIQKHKFYYNINFNLNNNPYNILKEIQSLTPFTRLITQTISAKETNFYASISVNKNISKRLNFAMYFEYGYDHKTGTPNNTEINKGKSLSFDANIFSNFKNSLYNFSLGFTGKKNYFSVKNNNFNYNYYSPYIELFNKISKKFYLKIKAKYDNYIFFSNKKFINTSFIFKYTLKNKLNFSLIGNNIFNMDTQQIITINNTDNFVEQKKIEIMPGFIGVEFKKSF